MNKLRLLLLTLTVLASVPAHAAAQEKQEPVFGDKSLSQWMEMIASKDDKERALGFLGLAALGPRAKPAVPKLIDLLDADNPSQPTMVLGAIGPDAAAAIPKLVRNLRRKGYNHGADQALGRMGAAEVLPLVAVLDHEDEDIRRWAIWALGRIGPNAQAAIPRLQELLGQRTGKERMDIAGTLLSIGKNPAAVKALRAGLQDKDSRMWACFVMENVGSLAKEAVPELISLLREKEGVLNVIQSCAIRALRNVGGRASGAVPELLATVKRERAYMTTADVVRCIDAMGPSSVPELIKALKDTDEFVLQVAVESLGLRGPAVKEVVPALEGLMKTGTTRVRVATALALWRISKHPQAVRWIIEAGQAKDASEHDIVWALRDIGPGASEAVPLLKEILKRGNVSEHYHIEALGNIGPAAKDAVPELEVALKDNDHWNRSAAAVALWKIAEHKDAVPSLSNKLKSKDEKERYYAARALTEIGEGARLALGELILAVDDKDDSVVRAAGEALGNIGPDAKSAIPALIRAMTTRVYLFADPSLMHAVIRIDVQAASRAGLVEKNSRDVRDRKTRR